MTRRSFVIGATVSLLSTACETIALRSVDQFQEQPERAPYIQNVTPISAVIAWRSNRDGEAAVVYGEANKEGIRIVARKGPTGNYAVLTNLNPNTRYFYKVMVDGRVLGREASFKTANGPQDTGFSFVVFGDSGSGQAPQWAIARLMERLTFDLALHTGDVVYPSGRDEDYDPNYFKPYANLIDHIPFYPALGNHDIKTEGGRPFRENFYLPGNEEYYDFSYGNAHFIALYSNRVMAGDDQTRWLERTLKDSTARWKIVYFHRPPFSSGPHGGEKSVQEIWVPLFEKYGVDLVFSGHDHDYERTHPINGVVYVVTGGGGARLYDVGQGPFTACSRKAYHVVHGSVSEDKIALEAIDEDGNVFDRYTVVKGVAQKPRSGCGEGPSTS